MYAKWMSSLENRWKLIFWTTFVKKNSYNLLILGDSLENGNLLEPSIGPSTDDQVKKELRNKVKDGNVGVLGG